MDKNIVVSLKTIVQAILIALGLYIIFQLGSIIGYVAISLLITISLEHTIQFFAVQHVLKREIGRSFAVLITYLIIFLVGSLAITLGLDPVITQTQRLIQTLINNQEIFTFGGNIQFSLSEIVTTILDASGGVLSATRSIFNNVTALISILIMAIYMSIDWINIKSRFVLIFKEKDRKKVEQTIVNVENNTGVWLKGQLFLMFVIGFLSYIGLKIVGVEFALALGIMAGIFEIIPIIGPLISAVVAFLVAIVSSPIKAFIIVGVFVLIQNIENNFLIPKIMSEVSGMSPLVILIGLLVGGNLFGIVGTIVAVPVLMISHVIIKSVLDEKK
ncbi:AI-2E family transporter [Patescibacteria group bacterium]